MLQTIYLFPQMIYLTLTGFLSRLMREFKNDERGLSGVVVAILLILVAVLAIILIWGFLSGWLAELWDRITGQGATIV